ncbi:MAG: DNA-directed RNA polymerase subunit beta, partial [Alicyclobacillus herbarius]|nr:DNA-directed RNA polymerase subunit beta [Alicyclobacillus herbarius]
MRGHMVKYGWRERRSYARIHEVLDLPNLIEIQQKSYQWFLEEGLREMFADISPIQDFTGNLVLEFIDYSLGEPKYDVEESKERDVTYAAPLRVKVRLLNKETGEVKEQEVFMGDFPLMTETGTFIINGAERVIVSQLVRSPSVYFNSKIDKNGKQTFAATVIPNRGAWLEFETDAKDIVYVRIDRTRKLPITVLLRALGLGTDQEIINFLGEDEYLRNTLDKDTTDSTERALIEIYERLRPGEPPTIENARALLASRFFDPKRYDLANVGRYKMNKKLHIKNRLLNQRLAETLVDADTNEIVAEAGQILDRRTLDKLLPRLTGNVGRLRLRATPELTDEEEIPVQMVKIFAPNEDGRILHVVGNGDIPKTVKHITPADILSAVSYFFNLLHGVG